VGQPTLAVRFDDDDGGDGGKRKRRFSMDTADIVAVGILFLAGAAAIVAIVIAVGFVMGKVNGSDAFKIISACVGGSTISGIVAALLGKKSDRKE